MDADMDDAPDYLTRKKQGSRRMLFFICASTVVMWGVVSLFGQTLISDLNSIKSGARTTLVAPAKLNSTSTQQPQPPATKTEYIEPNHQTKIAAPSPPPVRTVIEQPALRQTSFHDGNYVPKGAHNVIRYEQPKPPQAEVKTAKKPLKVVVVGDSETYEERACRIFESGSIERRTCKMKLGQTRTSRD